MIIIIIIIIYLCEHNGLWSLEPGKFHSPTYYWLIKIKWEVLLDVWYRTTTIFVPVLEVVVWTVLIRCTLFLNCKNWGTFSFNVYNTPKSCFSSQNIWERAFRIRAAWQHLSRTLSQFVMSSCLRIPSRFLLPFVAGSILKSSFFEILSPCSMQMLCKTMHARVIIQAVSGGLSHFLIRTLHLPFNCLYAPSVTILALLSL